jgi:DNA-binding MarR family transcriptional regulator
MSAMTQPSPLFPDIPMAEENVREAIELLFFAYRDFTAEPDTMLAEFGFGRAHHRVIYFVGCNPGVSVGELLAILKITKQSLSRVLGQLMREGFIDQGMDVDDRRRRLLDLTEKGRALERRLTDLQSRRIARAFAEAGPEAVEGFRNLMRGLINEEDRHRIRCHPSDLDN